MLTGHVSFGQSMQVKLNGKTEYDSPITLSAINGNTIAERSSRSGNHSSGPVSIGMESKYYRPSTVSGGPRTFKGKINEILVFKNNLSEAEMAKIHHYLAKKWNLTATVDSDGDGFTDAIEVTEGTSAVDASSNPLPDLSDAVDAQIGEASGFDAVEGNLALWLDASNINGLNNSGLANGDAIAKWTDLSGNGNDVLNQTEINKPTFNGTSLTFNGSSYLSAIPPTGLATGNNPRTVIVLVDNVSLVAVDGLKYRISLRKPWKQFSNF